jgi:hypothetical protein
VACLKDSLIYTLNGIVQEKKYYKYNAFDSLKEVVTTNAAVNQDLETWEYDDTNHPHLPSSYESKNWYGNAWTKDVIVLYQYNSNGQINTELKYKFSYPINVLDIDWIPKGIYFLSSDNGYITKVLKY